MLPKNQRNDIILSIFERNFDEKAPNVDSF
jgi:hypothetical protein